MIQEQIHQSLVELGKLLKLYFTEGYEFEYPFFNQLRDTISSAHSTNQWHYESFVIQRLNHIADFLVSDGLKILAENFNSHPIKIKMIGHHQTEHISLESFPTLVCVLLSGNQYIFQESKSKDKVFKLLCNYIKNNYFCLSDRIVETERNLQNCDAWIINKSNSIPDASDNYYTNRMSLMCYKKTSVGILSGNETKKELEIITDTIFNYFGLSSANVKTLFVPEGYNFQTLIDTFEKYAYLINHNKYANNYQYNQSVYLFNQIPHLDNGFMLVKKDETFFSPTGVIYYQYYKDLEKSISSLRSNDYIKYIYSFAKNEGTNNYNEFIHNTIQPSSSLFNFLKKVNE